MRDAPESMSHMSDSVLSDRSEWDVYLDLVGSSLAVEAQKRWMTMSCAVATLAFVLDDFPLELEFAFGALEDLFLSLLSFFFVWHSKTSCPILLQWVHFLLLSCSQSPRFRSQSQSLPLPVPCLLGFFPALVK